MAQVSLEKAYEIYYLAPPVEQTRRPCSYPIFDQITWNESFKQNIFWHIKSQNSKKRGFGQKYLTQRHLTQKFLDLILYNLFPDSKN